MGILIFCLFLIYLQSYFCRDNLIEKISKYELKICNYTTLKHYKTMSIAHEDQNNVFTNPLNISYYPLMRKTGSTSMTVFLKQFQLSGIPVTEAVAQGYSFISIINHPLIRALAGYYQIEVFFTMGWINGIIEKHDIRWWNKTCKAYTNFGEQHRKYHCMGTPKSSDRKTKLQSLVDFFEEVKEKGFWDPHILPQSRVLYEAFKTSGVVSHTYEMKNIDAIMTEVSEKFNRTYVRVKHMGGNKLDWSVSWPELVSISKSTNSHEQHLAKKAINLLCLLYQADIACISNYVIPECA